MGGVLTYAGEMRRATDLLLRDPRTLFVGQSLFGANGLAGSLSGVPPERKIEVPVFEDTQVGLCIGLALEGFLPVSVFPRFNFLLLAMNQLVNHLDRLPEMGDPPFRPKVLVRVVAGAARPLNAGPQHSDNFVAGLRAMLRNVVVEDLVDAAAVYPAFARAAAGDRSVVFVEYGERYLE